MKSRIFLSFTLFVFTLSLLNVSGQSRTNKLIDSNRKKNKDFNFYEIQKAFNDYWEPYRVNAGYYFEKGEKKKADGFNQFKRWEWYWQYRVDPKTGEFPEKYPADIRKEIRGTKGSQTDYSNWSSLGPDTSFGGRSGLGRINCIGFREGDNNTFYVGSPSGGLWKTTDGGSSWTPLTDNNAVIGVSDVVVIAGAAASSDTLYIATGDRDQGALDNLPYGYLADNHTIGVLKSVDGGSSWSTTGLSFNASDKKTTNRIIVDPDNSSILLVATTDGVYKTTDGGTNWTLKTSYEMTDLEFNPSNSNIVYGGSRIGGHIWRSTDKGETWTEILDATSSSRVELAVSEADPDKVYAVICKNDQSLKGIWRSDNAGAGFAVVYDINITADYDNLLHGDCSPRTLVGGQGKYDLSIACDPTDADIVYVGGINTWKSTDGGSSFDIINHWDGTCSGTVEHIHADKHNLAFQPVTNALFECNDGGLFKSVDGGAHWTELSNGLVISQIYRLAVSSSSSSELLCGLQDNGTKNLSSGSWSQTTNADGMCCAIDFDNNDRQYATWQQGGMYYTNDHWSSYITKRSSDYGNIWLEPMVMDPNYTTRIFYAKKYYLQYSHGSSTTWNSIYPSPSLGDNIWSMDVAKQNSDYIYVATKDSIYRTNEGRDSHAHFTNITGNLPTANSHIADICVSRDDTNHIWVALGNFNGDCVFETTDGGNTWTNISSGLPQVPVMCVVENWQNPDETELYCGTDVGVYQKVGSNDWVLYSTNLPNVVVTDLAIYFDTLNTQNSRLRAATFGRGAWETELPPTPPVAAFTVDETSPVIDDTVSFTDQSGSNPTYWFWSISPSTYRFVNGTDEYTQSPQVAFSDTGYYTVSLYVENSAGNDTETKSNHIHVTPVTYCSASGGSDGSWEEYISGVEMGSISNTGSGQDEYTDYPDMITNVTPGISESLTVTLTWLSSGDDIGVWIDWDQNGEFNDTDEKVACTTAASSTNNFNINIPATATPGKTRMRIRLKWSGANCGSACGSTDYGEVEDYRIFVIPPTLTWTGSTSDDWNTTGNWDENTVPDENYSVNIPSSPSGGNFPVIHSGTVAQCYDLTIEPGANLQIYGTLTVNDTLNNQAAASDLVIKSDASGTGSLITSTDDVPMTVQRYFTDGSWHLFSAPQSGATANCLYFGGSPDVWLTEYHEEDDSWNYITALSTPLPTGKGFGIWLEDAKRSNETIDFEGSVRGSSLTLDESSTPPLSYHSGHGYNLIGNPYPCALDWDKSDWTYNNIDGSIWVYDPGAGSYKTRNSHGAGSLTDGEIPPLQGFFIHVTGTSPSITIPKEAKVHPSHSFYKQSSTITELNDYIVLSVVSGTKNDEAWLVFNNMCSENFDAGWDVMKMTGDADAPQIAFKQNNLLLDISATKKPVEREKSFPIGFTPGADPVHLLKLKESVGIDDYSFILEDIINGIFVNLRKQREYSFTSSINDDDRFVLYLQKINNSIVETDDENIVIYPAGKSIVIERSEKYENLQLLSIHSTK